MFEVEIKGKKLIITADLQQPTPSTSGKTLVIATSHGNQATDCSFNGKALVVGFNAYVHNK